MSKNHRPYKQLLPLKINAFKSAHKLISHQLIEDHQTKDLRHAQPITLTAMAGINDSDAIPQLSGARDINDTEHRPGQTPSGLNNTQYDHQPTRKNPGIKAPTFHKHPLDTVIQNQQRTHQTRAMLLPNRPTIINSLGTPSTNSRSDSGIQLNYNNFIH